MDPATSKGSIEIIATLLREAEKLGLFERLLTVFKTKPRILLLGCTGTGKTNLLASLSNPHPVAIRHDDRTIYTEAKNLILDGHPYRFIDTTGDVERGKDRTQAVREAMSARGGIAGILNVVCDGYHEYAVPRSEVFLEDSVVKPEYLEFHRHEEVNQLAEWSTLLGDPLTSHWLITVVTKADLWWDRSEQVLEYYGKGTYFSGLGDARTLRPRVLPYSAVFHKFYGEGRMAGTFDAQNHTTARHKLIEALMKALLSNQGAG